MASGRIGEVLLELGYLTTDRLEQAQQSAGEGGLRFGEHLCRLGFLHEDDLAHALARQAGIPRVELNGRAIASEALACVPAELAQRYRALPLSVENGQLELAMAAPLDLAAVDDLCAVSGREIVRRYARPTELADAIRRHYGTSAARMATSLVSETDDGAEGGADDAVGQLHELAREPSLINLVNLLILEAAQDRASDIHIEPFERELKVKYRIDGVLHEMPPPPKHLQAALVSRIKIMAALNIAERFVPQDGHIEFSTPKGRVDLRVSTVPTVFGESVVLRILDKSSTLRGLDKLGMSEAALRTFDAAIRRPHGIALVTGPTGSGKTTTLYAALNRIYTPAKKIITIEDPVEFNLHGINQMQVNPKRGLTFANGLRAILRQDPDIIMVGEIRDGETADIAIRSALTGHLVFSTLHTNDAAGAITRLIDMGVEPFLLATSVEAVVAQRLVRLLCERCAEPYELSEAAIDRLGDETATFAGAKLRHGHGCQECHQTGFRGRLAIFEMIRVNESMRDVILERPTSSQISRAAGAGFVTMRQDGYRKVLAGVTTLEEVWRVTEDAQHENGATQPLEM